MKIFRKLYPFFLAVVSFNIIRLVTDIPNHDTLWHDGVQQLKGLAFTTLLYYFFDFQLRLSIKNKWFTRKNRFDVVKEYAAVILSVMVVCNLSIYLGVIMHWLYMGNPVKDYIIANVVSIPILTLYYTVINRENIEDEYREQASQMEKIKNDQLETELKYLQAQYHPHFLFNILKLDRFFVLLHFYLFQEWH